MFYTLGDWFLKIEKIPEGKIWLPSGIAVILIIPIGVVRIDGIVFLLAACGLVVAVLG
jgi:hypothetical protein